MSISVGADVKKEENKNKQTDKTDRQTDRQKTNKQLKSNDCGKQINS